MGISGRVIAVVGAGLLLAAGACSRGEEKASTPERLVSAIAGVSLVNLSALPRSPENGGWSKFEEHCEAYRAKSLTATGRAVEALGWKVTSEAPLGRYRVVSFVSGFDPGTSGVCTVRNGNIGVFDGARLVALAYTAARTGPDWHGEVTLGTVEPLESGALLVWGGGYPAPPMGELVLDQDRPRLTAVAAEHTVCGRKATVPNVYGQPIETARTTLIARGWRPAPAESGEWEHSGAERLKMRGVIEAESCSGTGMGYCAFNYQSPAGALGVTTAGEEDRVLGYSVDCRG